MLKKNSIILFIILSLFINKVAIGSFETVQKPIPRPRPKTTRAQELRSNKIQEDFLALQSKINRVKSLPANITAKNITVLAKVNKSESPVSDEGGEKPQMMPFEIKESKDNVEAHSLSNSKVIDILKTERDKFNQRELQLNEKEKAIDKSFQEEKIKLLLKQIENEAQSVENRKNLLFKEAIINQKLKFMKNEAFQRQILEQEQQSRNQEFLDAAANLKRLQKSSKLETEGWGAWFRKKINAWRSVGSSTPKSVNLDLVGD